MSHLNLLKRKELHKYFKDLDDEKPDIQGLIVRGYKSLRAATYILLRIADSVEAKAYFRFLVENYITNAVKPPADKITPNNDPVKALQIAFTNKGLKKLGLDGTVYETFSREFKEGMDYIDVDLKVKERSILLGDMGTNSPDNWHWGNKNNHVDCMLMLFAVNNSALQQFINEVYETQKQGVEEAYRANTFETNLDVPKEHFGFRDGISQPVIKGLSKSDDLVNDTQMLINPGEIILGHKNEYDNYSPSPFIETIENNPEFSALPETGGRKDLGKNGTYLVFRQMEQHVERFWRFLHNHSKEDGSSVTCSAIKLGAKMVGRWPDGKPLVLSPNAEPIKDELLNDFYYDKSDAFGIKCPFGAHIRRTNPRDQVHAGRNDKDSLQMTKRHRMLRRGRIYGQPLDEQFIIDNIFDKAKQSPLWQEENDDQTRTNSPVRGLHFICLVSDIGRQFEFVQNVWANTATFGNLCNEVDPLISPRPTTDQPECHEFTAPKETLRNRYTMVPQFTTVIGGAYFFLPGIAALKYIIKP